MNLKQKVKLIFQITPILLYSICKKDGIYFLSIWFALQTILNKQCKSIYYY